MRKGKIASQVAHASMGVLLQNSITRGEEGSLELVAEIDSNMRDWLDGAFTKIVVYVKTDQEWYELLEKLSNQDTLPYYVITDNGTTEFKGVKTQTCVAIGPAKSEDIDVITGGYQLL